VPQSVGEAHGLLHVDHYDNVGPEIYDRMVTHGQAFAAATGRPYRRTNHVISRGREEELQATLALYERSDLVLSSRLHGCILALAHNCKLLAVSGDYKVEAFMAAAGLGDWVIGLEDVEELPAYFEALERQPSAAKFVKQARQQNSTIAEQVKACLAVPIPGRKS
jgi:polysaccharide pyruvyl transferase WcaK-like protein